MAHDAREDIGKMSSYLMFAATGTVGLLCLVLLRAVGGDVLISSVMAILAMALCAGGLVRLLPWQRADGSNRFAERMAQRRKDRSVSNALCGASVILGLLFTWFYAQGAMRFEQDVTSGLVLKYMVLNSPNTTTDYWKQTFQLDAASNDSPATNVYRKNDNIDVDLVQKLAGNAMLFVFVSAVLVGVCFVLPFGRRAVAGVGLAFCLLTAMGASEKYTIFSRWVGYMPIEDQVSFMQQYPGKRFELDLDTPYPYKYATIEKHDVFADREPWSAAFNPMAVIDLSGGMQLLLYLTAGTFAAALIAGRRVAPAGKDEAALASAQQQFLFPWDAIRP